MKRTTLFKSIIALIEPVRLARCTSSRSVDSLELPRTDRQITFKKISFFVAAFGIFPMGMALTVTETAIFGKGGEKASQAVSDRNVPVLLGVFINQLYILRN